MVCRTTKLLTERSPCQMCFFYDNRNNSGNGRNGRMSRGDIQQRQQDYCFQFVNCALFLEDNRDNRNNKKNGRNCGMSQGDIQLGQQDYCCQLVFLVNCRVFFQTTTMTTGITGTTVNVTR